MKTFIELFYHFEHGSRTGQISGQPGCNHNEGAKVAAQQPEGQQQPFIIQQVGEYKPRIMF